MENKTKGQHCKEETSKRATYLDVGEVDGCKLGPSLCVGVGSTDGVLVGTLDGLQIRSKIKRKGYAFSTRLKNDDI